MRLNADDVGQQDGVPGRSLLHVAAGGGLDLEAEEIRRLAFVDDDENLREHAAAAGGFEQDDLIDLRLEKSALRFGHDCHEWRSGARKLTVERRTTSLRWL